MNKWMYLEDIILTEITQSQKEQLMKEGYGEFREFYREALKK